MQPAYFPATRRMLRTALLLLAALPAAAQNVPNGATEPVGSANLAPVPPAIYIDPVQQYTYERTWVPQVPLTDPAVVTGTYNNPAYISTVTEYKDGFNNPLQTLQHNVVPGKDIIVPFDNRPRRQQNSYLPYTGGSSGIHTDAFQEQKAYYDNLYPAELATAYSGSKNNSDAGKRSQISYAPGKSQVGQGRGTETSRITNAASEVRYWQLDGSGQPQSSNYYPAASLLGQLTKAPTDNTTTLQPQSRVYKDKDGRVVLQQTADSSYMQGSTPMPVWASTYYVYDGRGRLRYVLPPKAVQLLEQNGWTMTSTILDNLCFQYRYDDKGRKVEERLPGKDWEYFVYDKRDRLVLYQDGNLRGHKWMYTIYDALDRPVATGIFTSTDWVSPRTDLEWTMDNSNTYAGDSQMILFYYLKRYDLFHFYPGAMAYCTPLTYTYYDDYQVSDPNNVYWNTYDNVLQLSGEATGISGVEALGRSSRTQGMVTGTQVRTVLSPHGEENQLGKWRTTIPYYDDKGRVIYTYASDWKDDPLQPLHMQYSGSLYDFAGKVLLSKHILTNQNAADGAPTRTERNRYNYDAATGRLSQTLHKMDNGAWTQMNAFIYDDMGRVQRKIIGNNGEVQDFSYNIRGQLTGINGTYAETGEKGGYSRSFGEALKYDYGFSQPRYDGKISGMIWRGSSASIFSREHAYGYSYDPEGRLKAADYRTMITGSFNPWSNSDLDYTVSNLFYDKNGNILSMKQRGVKPGSGPIDMDVLSYQYENSGQSNRLAAVTDNAASTAAFNLGDFQDGSTGGVDYSYDANGNLGTDANKSITATAYTWFNKPQSVTVDGKLMEFSYDAAGNKIQELQPDNGKQTDYIGNFVYEKNKLSYVLTAEGRTHFDPDNVNPVSEEFLVKDHLGNVRSVTNVYTYDPIQYLATYEVASAGLENLMFNNIDDVRAEKPSSTDPNDIKAAMLDGATNPIGTSLLVKVMAGDQVGMNVNNFYQEYDPGDDNPLSADDMLSNIIGTLTGGAGGVTGGESHDTKLVSQLFNSHSYTEIYNGLLDNFTDPGRPKAYLNYMFFDENMHLIPDQSGAWQVNGNGTWESIGTGDSGPKLVANNGYLAVFLSNRSRGTICASCSNVYFDWLRVSITKGNLLEENHYYPHGLPIQGLAGVASGFTEQRRKYQSNEYIKDLGLNWMDFNARSYDPQIGRFLNVDPLADAGGQQVWSPYAAMGNAPESQVDPNGTITSASDARIYQNAFRNAIYSLMPTLSLHMPKGPEDPFAGMSWGGMSGFVLLNYYNQANKETKAIIDGVLTESGTAWGNIGAAGGSTSDAESSESGPVGGVLKRSGLLGWLLDGIEEVFGSAHTPNWATMPFIKTGTFSIEDTKALAKESSIKQRGKQPGSYTIIFANGQKYHGKGPIDRMLTSAIEKMAQNHTVVVSVDWRPASSDRQAFKDEYRRLQTDATPKYPEGYANPINYNIIQSPGKTYIEQDGY